MKRILERSTYIILNCFIAVAVLCCFRLVFLATYLNFNADNFTRSEILNLFLLGSRVDAKVTAIAMALPFCLSFFAILPFKRWLRFIDFLQKPIVYFMLFGLFALDLINHYYFKNFGNYIDIRIFGLNDGFDEVMASAWADYPIVRSVLAVVLLSVCASLLGKKLSDLVNPKIHTISPKTRGAILLIYSCLFIIAARGTLSTFPLERNHLTVSANQTVNVAINNGPFALFWAYRDFNHARTLTPVTLAEGEAAAKKIGLSVSTPFKFEDLFTKPRPNPANIPQEKKRPNVVVAMMESMGSDLLRFDGKDFDVTGALRPHLEQDFWWKRFFASGSGTNPSVEYTLFNSDINSITNSQLAHIRYTTTAFKPFLDAGYDFIYITAGSATWSNLGPTLLLSGATKVVDQSTMKQMYPDIQLNVWGVFDHIMFKTVKNILNEYEKSDRPVLIFALSTSNHIPYLLPNDYTSPDFKFPEALQKRFLVPEERAKKVVASYRYSNNALGEFLTSIKNSPRAADTIVAATGDHPLREILAFENNEDIAYAAAVPFYMYLPKPYQKDISFEPYRLGSHKDIFKTLYERAIPDFTYYSLGADILDAHSPENSFYGKNFALTSCTLGLIDHRSLNPKYYNFTTNSSLTVTEAPASSIPLLSAVFQKLDTIEYLSRWQILYQAGLAKPKKVYTEK